MSSKHAGCRPNYHYVDALTVQLWCLHDFLSIQVQIAANRTELPLRIRRMKQADSPDYPVITPYVPNSPPNFANSIQDVYKDNLVQSRTGELSKRLPVM
jgi:hypothetical protein